MKYRRLAFLAALTTTQGLPRSTPVPPPNASIDAEFTRIVAIRELADGRVLIADGGDRRLYVADFTSGRTLVIGREGGGPGEYGNVGQLFALAGDSTLLVDVPGGRWLLLHGAEIVQTVAADAPGLRDGFRNPSGADAAGLVIATRAMGASSAPRRDLPRQDSVHLFRVSRANGRVDTLATLQARPARIQMSGPRGQPTSISITTNPLAAGDLTAMFPDGAVAIARVNPYRVEWILANGARVAGPPLPFNGIPVSEREKNAVMIRQAARSGRAPTAPGSVDDWPAIIPPFLTGALLAAPDGRLWIRRTPTAQAPETMYDVVDRTGKIAGRLTMPPNETIAGIGRSMLYSVLTDDDGVQHLRRHPLRVQ
jgi:hypothetical protein